MRSKDLRTSKNKILKALLCLCRYFVCASYILSIIIIIIIIIAIIIIIVIIIIIIIIVVVVVVIIIIIIIIIYLNYLRLIRCTLPGQLLPWEQATTSS